MESLKETEDSVLWGDFYLMCYIIKMNKAFPKKHLLVELPELNMCFEMEIIRPWTQSVIVDRKKKYPWECVPCLNIYCV